MLVLGYQRGDIIMAREYFQDERQASDRSEAVQQLRTHSKVI